MKKEVYIEMSKKKRKYELKQRFEKAYKTYKKMYKDMQKKLRRRGFEMFDTMLTKREYRMNRDDLISKGRKTNINQTLVSEQAFAYSQKEARRFKETAEKYDLSWKDTTVTQLRRGAIDVSEINELLKEEHPDWTGSQRADFISYEVFGSE
jgi:hypothetical protein